MMMNKTAKIYVAGHRGMAGAAIVRPLQGGGYTNIFTRTHAELDFLDQGIDGTCRDYCRNDHHAHAEHN